MVKHLRKEEILEHIRDRRVCSVEELQGRFSVSVSTIHRDLNVLEREGRINKFYGKVTIKDERELYRSRISVNVDLKRRIARRALEFVEDGDCIFLDNSTTTYYLAEELCRSSYQNIMVVSNSALVIDLFLKNKNIGFVSTGGKLNKDFDSFVGPQAVRAIDDFNGNRYFFSTSSISREGGVSDVYSPDEIAVKTRMYTRAREAFLLVDSSKFGRVSTIKWFELDEIRNIITDSKIEESTVAEFREMGLNVILA
jgi:DeoR/GlpR family transcriptional regulator of sugar metabolism